MLKKAKKNKKGFTLVELIVVIAIMAILAAVLIPTVTNKIKSANEQSANSTASSIANAIQSDLVAIDAGLSSSGLNYLASASTLNTTCGYTLGTAKEDGNTTSTISYDADDDLWTIVVSVGNADAQTYTVSVADTTYGKITKVEA